MRKVFSILLFFVCHTTLVAQDTTMVLPDKLPAEGILLDKGWKFHGGDNLELSKPGLDDSKWHAFDPTKDIHELPQLWKDIGWFRLKIYLDSPLQSQPLALIIQQSGASEVYVNGKLLHRYGNVSSHAERVAAYNPLDKPLPLQFARPGENVVAVRYSLQPDIFYTAIAGRQNPAFRMSVNNMESAIGLYDRTSINTNGYIMLWIGIYLLLLILHLAFYLYYPTQKANLYFALYALSGLTCYLIELNTINQVKYIFYQLNVAFGVFQFGNFFLLAALYFLLKQKRGWIFWSLLALTILGVLLSAVVYVTGFFISSVIINTLVNLETVRISFKAVKSKQRGAWLIVTGAIGFFVFWCLFLFLTLYGIRQTYIGNVLTIRDLIWALAFLCIPIATSLFLGLDFAFTSRSLQQKLVEVNELAQRNLAQQEEKQQILASQKEMLEQQVTERTSQLKQSLEELKATQQQLVQSEKMASLGELTAGIAHEIQNPLNFVNNFSETNVELLDELQQELNNGNYDEARAIAVDAKDNEQKIMHHGKRADAIVKGMLEHSRVNSGQKEPADINKLAGEYLRLAYHGFRAKDKSFNVDIQTHFDNTIGKINIVPQEIGRVLLNLFNNAFYAVNEKKLRLNGTFEPMVQVTSARQNGRIVLKVTDNGNGISQNITDKIFQPFFTTKPSGQGTGLGLSLSYDIIKAHNGELKVESKEGEGSEFTIVLPL